MFASGLVLLACFIVWQVGTGSSWRIDSWKLLALFLESLVFAVALFFLFAYFPVLHSRAAAGEGIPGGMQKLVLYCGAGIYEELVFRGFLLGSLMLISTRLLHENRMMAAAGSALLAALLFSLFHYVGPTGDPFAWGTFLQRTCGGLYFSAMFVMRGFGVTAAAHAFYDMLVGLLVG